MSIEAHVPTCRHCGSTKVTDVDYDTRRIELGTWQGVDGGRDQPFVRFNCGSGSCLKPNQYDLPST